MGNAPACASEALDMVRAGLGYLAAADGPSCLRRRRRSAYGGWRGSARS
jgi:hypothetical protein